MSSFNRRNSVAYKANSGKLVFNKCERQLNKLVAEQVITLNYYQSALTIIFYIDGR